MLCFFFYFIFFFFISFFFNDTATTEIYTLSLQRRSSDLAEFSRSAAAIGSLSDMTAASCAYQDRKSTRLNSSHRCISYAVFCLKKKTQHGRGGAPGAVREQRRLFAGAG